MSMKGKMCSSKKDIQLILFSVLFKWLNEALTCNFIHCVRDKKAVFLYAVLPLYGQTNTNVFALLNMMGHG